MTGSKTTKPAHSAHDASACSRTAAELNLEPLSQNRYHISGRGQTEAAQDLRSGIPAKHRQHKLIEGAGHYGIFSGKRWHEVVYPQVRDFIRKADKVG